MGTVTANTVFPVGYPDHRASSDAPVETPSESKETRTHDIQFQTLNTRATVQAVQPSLYDDRLKPFKCGTCEYTYESNPDDLNSTVNLESNIHDPSDL
ncbi:unnamed protein product [Clavelina lepadiformis]|uniref:Uncharacterized protein n=1 Tax=Clavelina lepadiformis TaxID=159417 RepID=A0ABP0FZS7_CLALP